MIVFSALVDQGFRSWKLSSISVQYLHPCNNRHFHEITATNGERPQILTSRKLDQLMHNIQNNCLEIQDGNELIQQMVYQRWPHSKQTRPDANVDRINCISSLPQFYLLKSSSEIMRTLEHDRPDLNNGLRKDLTFKYRMLQGYGNFFRAGILNVWKNYWNLRRTAYRKIDPLYVFDNGLDRNDTATGNPKDKKLLLRSKTIEQIVSELATAVRCKENIMKGKMWLFESESDRHYIRLKRNMMQQMLRNKFDASKLPFFAVILVLLEELSVAVCWLSPYILPTTCLYPKFMPRYFARSIKAQRRLKELRKNKSLKDIASGNPFSIDTEEAVMMCEFLMINTSFKWANCLENKDFMRRRLLQRYKEIALDNYLIIRDGGVEKLTDLELFSTNLRRGLIDLDLLTGKIKKKPNGDYKEYFDFDQMRNDLRTFIVNFDDRRNNIGLFGLFATTSCI